MGTSRSGKSANDDRRGTPIGSVHVESYVADRTDVKQATQDKYRNTGRLLVAFFGGSKTLRSITPADAERWLRWLASEHGHATSTSAKHIKRVENHVRGTDEGPDPNRESIRKRDGKLAK